MEDLNKSIEFTTMATKITAQDHPERPDWLTSLGVCLRLPVRKTQCNGRSEHRS